MGGLNRDPIVEFQRGLIVEQFNILFMFYEFYNCIQDLFFKCQNINETFEEFRK